MIISAAYDGPPYWDPGMPQPCDACQRQDQLTGIAPGGELSATAPPTVHAVTWSPTSGISTGAVTTKSAFLTPERMKMMAQLAPVAVAPPQPAKGWPFILVGGAVAFYFLFVRKR